MNEEQLRKIRDDDGFIAALDQSGGSTPRALAAYGVEENTYSGEVEMFDLVHEMRSRIVSSPSFNGERILGAILFEMTMDRDIEGIPAAEYLWTVKGVVPFLKVDQGLADEVDGVQMMKPMPGLGDLLARATAKGIFGTKMRSVIKQASPEAIAAIVRQQFEIGAQILDAGLVPIIEPEVDIHISDKEAAEDLLKAAILEDLDAVPDGRQIMLKLTIPTRDDLFADLVAHPKVLRVVALSGGYTRVEANERLACNHGVVASFSRALSEGLSAQQTPEEFDAALDSSIATIFKASLT